MIFDTSNAASFVCTYDYWSFTPLNNLYYCWVQNTVSISSRSTASISSASGSHESGFGNKHVKAIWMSGGTMQYFPSGIGSVYPSLQAIYMGSGQLKEIRQSEMKKLTDLVSLDLPANKIEVLEQGLFEHNIKLQYISLTSNKINQIGFNVFDKLTSLTYLYLGGNTCINQNADTMADVQKIIKLAKTNCTVDEKSLTNFAYINIMQKLDNLKEDSDSLSSDKFDDKLSDLETEIRGLKLSGYKDVEAKVQNLKTILNQKTASEAKKLETTTSEASVKLETTNNLSSSTTPEPEQCSTSTQHDESFILKSKLAVFSRKLKALIVQMQSVSGVNSGSSYIEEGCDAFERKIERIEAKMEEFDDKFNKIIKALGIADS
ncbi:slit homolog 2 protein-like [Chironomus tepperi]|uniref:slit homolog 2 protein-like n=1 Tax=Chironomus tepperi TaxID=113505 RepID=UPI00391F0F2F